MPLLSNVLSSVFFYISVRIFCLALYYLLLYILSFLYSSFVFSWRIYPSNSNSFFSVRYNASKPKNITPPKPITYGSVGLLSDLRTFFTWYDSKLNLSAASFNYPFSTLILISFMSFRVLNVPRNRSYYWPAASAFSSKIL